MDDETIIASATQTFDGEPDWRRLERFLPLVLCGPFMAMHVSTLADGRRVHAYKHKVTRNSREEVEARIAEALVAHLALLRERGEPPPVPRTDAGPHRRMTEP